MNESGKSRPSFKLLLVEDDPVARSVLAEALVLEGYQVVTAENSRQALHQVTHKHPNLVLLDINMAGGTGYDVLRSVRAADRAGSGIDSRLPVIIVSGRATEMDRVRGFEFGCDDYLTKPFSFAELRGRIEAVRRRCERSNLDQFLAFGELEIDGRTRSVRLAGRPISLTAKEFALISELAADPLRVFTKQELLGSVWGFRTVGSTRTLDSHACRLRQKLSGGERRYVVNLWGTGYRLSDGEPPEREQ